MIKLKCTDQIPKECMDKYYVDEKGRNVVEAGEEALVECVCGQCGRDDDEMDGWEE